MKVIVIQGKQEGKVIEATEHILAPLIESGIAVPYEGDEKQDMEPEQAQTKELKEPKTRQRKRK